MCLLLSHHYGCPYTPPSIHTTVHTHHCPYTTTVHTLCCPGLGSLPGTAAEVLDDNVRAVLCPDKLSTREWLHVVEAAHHVGLRTTSTIMFGHVDDYASWARHLSALRALQARTGGLTEFVPLPFVHMAAPVYLQGMLINQCVLLIPSKHTLQYSTTQVIIITIHVCTHYQAEHARAPHYERRCFFMPWLVWHCTPASPTSRPRGSSSARHWLHSCFGRGATTWAGAS